MTHYVAIVEDAGPTTAAGIWFPDLPGCFAAGDDVDEALRHAPEAIGLFAEALEAQGKALPAARSLSELRRDPAIADDLRQHLVALVSFPAGSREAAE
ncbi:type II toxin-antitoxin system HicB family antitoxin [Ancylobacter sp. Lp-2]|uniref:type II toxin-antitoxin system HicB family antitoxin n=1 Tax=Ancylobacter sp. Lp-2 TaxID=2881339 RepID=UPI001E4B5A76|nr:type II toxin-antitoxin system HicB family antitoxin [Ancylobacter sp. Lp-2]MCB4770877.1 type II toxin-antitoxin system HicB family antitoxin [Ancylobacter sp. Lp-2]